MSPGEDRQRAVATLARRKVLRDGVDAAFDWAEALPDEGKEAVQFKLELLRRVGGAAAELDPERAAERAGRLADGPYANGVLRRVGTRWATRDGEAAMRWLATLPSGFARDDGVGETYRFWVRSSREEALAFMRGPAGEEAAYEPARALYAQVLAREDPLAAIDVAREISDDKLRWASVGRVWRQWWVDDADAANAWFEANAEQIPEFYRQRIRIIPQAYRRMAKEKASAAAKGAESPEAP
jgi:hypothetical protein